MTDVELTLKKLRSEIDSGKKAIKLAVENPLAASLSAGLFSPLEDPSARVLRLAQQQKKMGEQEMELELELEEERVKRVVRELEELHPPVLETCPICLEDIRIRSTAAACSMFSCCGGWMCIECANEDLRSGNFPKCPLCREVMPLQGDQQLYNKRLLSCVERGVAWAQFQAGGKYESGEMGVGGRPNMEKAMKHYLLSAEQNHPPALSHLGRLSKDGVPGVMKKSATKALEYEQKAADLGNFHAMMNVALTHFEAEKLGIKVDYPMAVKYATLASHYATDDKTAAAAAGVLGILFQDGTGLDDSSENLAAHYLGLAVKYDASPFGAGFLEQSYSTCLLLQHESLYPFHLTGFNVLPRVLFWLEKSANTGQSWAKGAIESLKSDKAGQCNTCKASEASSGKKFLRCGRCKLYYYCSKKCQKQAWNAGHKVDCKSVYD